MATVRLADIIDVTVFNDLPPVNNPTLTALSESGIIVGDQLLAELANAAGKKAELPFWNDLSIANDPNISSDDPAVYATPEKVGQTELNTRKIMVNNAWQAADLARELAMGADAMRHIRNRVDRYWQHQFQRRLVNMALGVMLDNIANDGGDMVFDISLETTVGQTEANWFSRTAMTGAAFTLGDHWQNTGAIVVHSVVMKRMVDNDDIDYIPDSKGNMTIPTFLGRIVLVDDGVSVIAGTTSGFRYVSYLFGAGAFGFGSGSAVVPTEVERDALAANGAGVETLISRKTWILHPFGMDWTDSSVAGISATNAEFALAANWDRVLTRKLIPMAFLITNG